MGTEWVMGVDNQASPVVDNLISNDYSMINDGWRLTTALSKNGLR